MAVEVDYEHESRSKWWYFVTIPSFVAVALIIFLLWPFRDLFRRKKYSFQDVLDQACEKAPKLPCKPFRRVRRRQWRAHPR
jgi:hypothetical protein